ncbi:MAG: extracellular solute-binding protein [Conexivisphaerales archaeon]
MTTKKIKSISKALSAILVIIIIIIAGVGVYYYYTTTIVPPSSKITGSITVAAEAGYNDAALEQIAKDYMAANPGTTIHVVTLSFDTALTDYQTAFSTGTDTYDVVFFPNVGYLGTIDKYLVNLKPYLSNTNYFPASYNVSDILPSMLAPFEINGTLYALPNSGDVMLFYYRPSYFNNATNQQLFQQEYGYALPNPANTTLTLQQLVNVADFFNGQHGAKYGIVMMTGPGDDDMIQTFLTLFGGVRVADSATLGPVTAPYGDMFSSNGQILSNTSIFQSALSAFSDLIKASEDPLSATFTTVPGTFARGDAPMMIYWTPPLLTLGNSSLSSVSNDWAVAPTMPGGVSETGGVGLGIYNGTHNMPLALSFLEFATSPNESINYMTIDSLLPFRYSGFSYAISHHFLSAPLISAVLSNLENSVQGPGNVEYWPQVSAAFRGEVPYIVEGTATVAQAASAITRASVSAGATAYVGVSPPPPLSGTINVVAMAGYNDAALKQIANDFMAQHPGTKINIDEIPYGSVVSDALTAFQANQSIYDVISLGSVGFLGQLGPYLLNIGPYMASASWFPSSWNSSDMITSLLSLYSYGGVQVGLPEAGGAMLFYYRPSYFNNATNQQLFQQEYGYALPNPVNTTLTLQQLVNVADFFNGQHGAKYGIVLMTGSGDDDAIQTYEGLIASARVSATSSMGQVNSVYGDLFTSNGVPIFNTTIGQTVMSDYLKLAAASEDPMASAYETVPGYFAAGDAPMMIYWNPPALYLNNPNRSAIVGDWAVAPTMPGGVSILGGTGLGIYKNTQNLPLAVAFIEFATSPSEASKFVQLDSLTPFRYSVFNQQVKANPSYAEALSAIASTMSTSIPGTANVAYWGQVSAAFRGELPIMYSGQESISTGMTHIEIATYQAAISQATTGMG